MIDAKEEILAWWAVLGPSLRKDRRKRGDIGMVGLSGDFVVEALGKEETLVR